MKTLKMTRISNQRETVLYKLKPDTDVRSLNLGF